MIPCWPLLCHLIELVLHGHPIRFPFPHPRIVPIHHLATWWWTYPTCGPCPPP